MANPVEQREAVRESIDGVLGKVRDHKQISHEHLSTCSLPLKIWIATFGRITSSPSKTRLSQITELETIITDFNGDDPALNDKL